MVDVRSNPAFQEFIKLLEENGCQGQAKDMTLMAWYLESMERKYDTVLQELRDVKAELAQMTGHQSPAKKALAGMVGTLEAQAERARERLVSLRDKILNCARDAVERFKDVGVTALDKAVSAMSIKNGLEHLQEAIQSSVTGTKEAIGRAMEMGAELRQAGAHIKDAGRAAVGLERLPRDLRVEGRLQSAVLAPLRGAHHLLSVMNNNTLAAIGAAERLEQAAEAARERQAERKPSIRQALRDTQAEIAARPAPVPEHDKKPKEAAR